MIEPQIENLFYNTPTRLSALKSVSDEYARILDVLTKYAVHNPTVAFLCKKVVGVFASSFVMSFLFLWQSSSASPSLSTPSSSTSSQAIRMLYGHSIAKELIHLKVSGSDQRAKRKDHTDEEVSDNDDEADWVANVHFTTANYQAKKIVFLLFINRESFLFPDRNG